jgi:Cu-Zn family superoxide dismutase
MTISQNIALLASFALASTVGCKKEEKEKPADTQKPDDTAKPDDAKKPDDNAGASHGADHMTHLDPGAREPAPVTKAVAIVHPTEGNKAKGKVWFEAADKGVTIKTEMEGLPPGKHAYHVHIYGDCTGADGKTAGTHFHFTGPSVEPPADIKIITGDLGDLEAGKDGKATAEATIETASLQGTFSIIGRAVIVHEKPNDPNDPPIGGAGGRLGCGVIGIVNGG